MILKLNDSVVGEKTVPPNRLVRFSVPWRPGVLTASALDDKGSVKGTCSLRSLGTETELSVQPEKETVFPGEICFIRLRYTDEYGDVLPLERGIMQVAAEGGELLGLGSACPYNRIGFMANQTDTYYGEALAAVRAGKEGTIRISATDGVYSGESSVQILQPER